MRGDIICDYLAGCEELPTEPKELKALIEKVSLEMGFRFTTAEIKSIATRLTRLGTSKIKEGQVVDP